MRLKKHKGQHLLTDKNMMDKIVRESKVTPEDNVIEIGAGTGLLTKRLCAAANRVISFEVDEDFKAPLMEMLEERPNLSVKFQDFLKFDLRGFLNSEPSQWRVIANIPYNITSKIVQKVINEGRERLKDVHMLVQREVAERIVAKPDTDDYGRLSIFAQFFCDNEVLFLVPPDVFYPPPQVDSALLRMEFKSEIMDINPRIYFTVVKSAFSKRRKQIRNAIKKCVPGLKGKVLDQCLEKAGIERQRRGETLSLEEFGQLASVIEETVKPKM